jgi:hypothetical protein
VSETVWRVTAEVAMDGEVGFINIALWASSLQHAIQRIETYFKKYDWEIVSVSRAIEADPGRDYGEETNQLLEEVRANHEYIRIGTYFTFPTN